MNTISHIGLAVAVLGIKRKNFPVSAALLGALAPDLAMFILVAWDALNGVSFQQIFDVNYFTPRWQIPITITNSVPLFGGLALIAYWRNWCWVMFFSLAALLHIAFDFPLHREDAHAHFWPFTDWKFISPVSYWDSNYYANYWAPVELLILAASLCFGSKWIKTPWLKWAFMGLMGIGIFMQAGLFPWHLLIGAH